MKIVIAILAAATALFGNAAATAVDAPDVVTDLRAYLAKSTSDRPPLAEQAFSREPLTRAQANDATALLVDDWRERLRKERNEEYSSKLISLAGHDMKFFAKTFGEKPPGGRSLFISMHGGGNAPARVNDQQWRNQQQLYEPAEGVYLAPRAPTNSWNLWHEAHIDSLFDRLIEDMIVFEDVDPNRVYLMGYSAGGDGVYQLAPRMADRWAAAAMMAGHPNETTPQGLRNVPFALHVGALDDGFNRNKVAAEWRDKLDELRRADPDGYEHVVELHAGRSHWMEREDAAAVPWMAGHTRNPFPRRIVWKQDDVTHRRFYWLAVDEKSEKAGVEVRADLDGQQIRIEEAELPALTVRVNDAMLDLDKDVTIRGGDRELFHGKIPRTIGMMAKSLLERGDPASIFVGEQTVELSP